MESKLKPMALQVAGWGLLHGDFFDFHEVAERLGVPAEVAREAVVYLRSLRYVDTLAESRSCKREVGKRSSKRVFVKVLAIHPRAASMFTIFQAQCPALKAGPAFQGYAFTSGSSLMQVV